MTDDSEIAAIAPAASSIQVAAGTVYGFETASGKKGLIKVVSVTSPDCSIAVKVQK